MFDWKLLADTITLARGGLGLVFVWLGITAGPEGLPTAVLLLLVCWTGDFIDGGVAKKNPVKRRTWIGDHDIEMDIFVSLCLGSYLALAEFVPVPWAIGYIILWLAIFALSGFNHALLELVQAPIYLTMIIVSLNNATSTGLLLVGWIIMALLSKWPRFSKRIVPEFLADMQEVLSWLRRQ